MGLHVRDMGNMGNKQEGGCGSVQGRGQHSDLVLVVKEVLTMGH